MSLPRAVKTDFADNDVLYVHYLNAIVENIEALSNGFGFEDRVIPAGAIPDGEISGDKFTSELRDWELLDSTVMGSNGDTLASFSFTPKKYLLLTGFFVATVNTTGTRARFNGDTGSNYARRNNDDGTESTASSGDYVHISPNAASGGVGMFTTYIYNLQSFEKTVQSQATACSSGAAAPTRAQMTGKWANTSNQISSILLYNAGAGDFVAGSYAKLYGHD